MEISVEQALKQQGYIMTYKCLIKELGTLEAIFLSELISKHTYFKNKNMLDDDGYFYCTYDSLNESTGIKRRNLETLRAKFKELGLIDFKRKGIPARIWYKIDYEKVLEVSKSISSVQLRFE